jgi:TolB-like protein/DNA-binding winged helix-turn-helix (wHTH) protein
VSSANRVRPSASSPPERAGVRFGVFELDSRSGELRKHRVRIRIQDKPLRILERLLQQPGEPVTRDDLRRTLWPDDVFVDFDHGLNSAINKLRDALGDSAASPRFVETLPRGYRFIAPVINAETAQEAPTSLLPALTSLAAAQSAPRWPTRTAVMAVVMVVALAAAIGRDSLRLGARPSPPMLGLAVLPFQNLSADPEQEFFSDGFTDEMIAQVGKLEPARLRVIARTSVMQYKRSTKKIDQIGAELGADYLLEGSVLRADSRVRITAQLVRVRDQARVWAQSYERDLRDVLALQTEVARTIASAIEVTVERAAGRPVPDRPRVSPDVYEADLKGRYFLDKSPGGSKKAIEYFQQAIDLDPAYAPAYAGLADAYGQLGWGLSSETSPMEAYPKARSSAMKALALDEGLAAAHVALARIRWKYEWNWPAAESEFRRAIELDPASAPAQESYFDYLSAMERHDEAHVELTRAAELDPVSLTINYDFGLHFARTGDYEQAIVRLKKAIDLDPTSGFVHHVLGELYVQRGMRAGAIAELHRAIELSGNVPHFVSALACVRAQSGDRRAAEQALRELKAQAGRSYVSPHELALLYTGLGDRDRALDHLERAYQERDPWLSIIRVQPQFASLNSEPRFQQLLQRIGLSGPESTSH